MHRFTAAVLSATAVLAITPGLANAADAPTDRTSGAARASQATQVAPPAMIADRSLLKRSSQRGHERRARPPKGARRLRIGRPSRKPLAAPGSTSSGRLLGTTGGTLDAKYAALLGSVAEFYRRHIPAAGGTYREPSIWWLQDGGTLCGRVVYNGISCQGQIGFSTGYSRNIFAQYGDATWATLAAHEFGHRAEEWLGYTNRGWFVTELYREGFADCMAGAWYRWMQDSGLTDTGGNNDGNEFRWFYEILADETTDQVNFVGHGDKKWRYQAGWYGYSTGFNGCVNWGNQLYQGR